MGGVVDSVTSGLFGGDNAARDASRAQQQGIQSAIGEYNTGYTGQQALWNPLRDFGLGAIQNLNALNSGDYSGFESSPDYLFALTQGNRALGQNQASRGNLFSGGAGREIANYNQGLASQQLGQHRNALFNQLGFGQNATSALSGALQNKTTGIANAHMGMGDARASGYLNEQQGHSNNLNNLLGVGGFIGGLF